jgi:polysaccharide chain length determinant protein (PEP-CTERM system associated)
MSPAIDAQNISISDIACILHRRRRLILVMFLLTVAAAVAVTLVMPKQYETRMKVLVKNERADMIVSPDRNGTSGYRGEVGETQINSEIELLTSDNLLRQIVSRCGLDRRQHASEPSVAVEKALKRLHSDLKVSPVRKANIIQVQYTDTDRRRAVAVLATLSNLYLEEHLKVHGTPGTYQFFKGQAERYRKELEDAESRLADFRRRENIVMLAQQKDVMLQKAAESDSALMQVEAAISEYAQKIAGTRRQLAAAPPRVVTQSRTLSNQYSVERLSTMLAELQNRRTQLIAKFRSDDRLVQETDQEIANTQAGLDRAMKLTGQDQATDVNPVYQALEIDLSKEQAQLAGLQSRRETLKRQTADYRAQMMRLANSTAAFDDLVRAQKEAEDNYLLYAKKTEEARITESLDQQKIANVAIAETPVEPHLPSKPNVALNVTLGIVLACFLSFGSAFGAERFRDTVEQPRELAELTGLPVLATSHGD